MCAVKVSLASRSASATYTPTDARLYPPGLDPVSNPCECVRSWSPIASVDSWICPVLPTSMSAVVVVVPTTPEGKPVPTALIAETGSDAWNRR